MLKNAIINRQATIKIAKALGELNKEVVFVGGAMVSLYTDDMAAEDIRPTKDIDITFQVTTVGNLESIREKLNERGFKEARDEKVICRFKYEDLLVDVMSTHEIGWAPSNKWFAPGFARAIQIDFGEIEINILPLPYFLASKMDAFFDRGIIDIYASHDFEDIIYLFNYTSDIAGLILSSEQDVVQYLKECVAEILGNNKIKTAINGQLYFDNADERMEVILEKMELIINGI